MLLTVGQNPARKEHFKAVSYSWAYGHSPRITRRAFRIELDLPRKRGGTCLLDVYSFGLGMLLLRGVTAGHLFADFPLDVAVGKCPTFERGGEKKRGSFFVGTQENWLPE